MLGKKSPLVKRIEITVFFDNAKYKPDNHELTRKNIQKFVQDKNVQKFVQDFLDGKLKHLLYQHGPED